MNISKVVGGKLISTCLRADAPWHRRVAPTVTTVYRDDGRAAFFPAEFGDTRTTQVPTGEDQEPRLFPRRTEEPPPCSLIWKDVSPARKVQTSIILVMFDIYLLLLQEVRHNRWHQTKWFCTKQ